MADMDDFVALGCKWDAEKRKLTWKGCEMLPSSGKGNISLYLYDTPNVIFEHAVNELNIIKDEHPNNIGIPTVKKLDAWVEFLNKRRAIALKIVAMYDDIIEYHKQRMINIFGKDNIQFKPYKEYFKYGWRIEILNGLLKYSAYCTPQGEFSEDIETLWFDRVNKADYFKQLIDADLKMNNENYSISSSHLIDSIEKNVVRCDCWYHQWFLYVA